jgi:uncharacterized Zn finger protein
MARRKRANRFSNDLGDWPEYVPVAERRARAMRKAKALSGQGVPCRPVAIEGRRIASSFWGAAWCDNLETYSDYASRLPRGRSYVRTGAVIDLAIEPGEVRALVSGSEVYTVSVAVKPQPKAAWAAIVKACTGQIGSLVDLLKGELSPQIMGMVSRREAGLFPEAGEISFRCSCPDAAWMCKHVAAALYGVGARLDHEPALLFRLRGVDPEELILKAAAPAAAQEAAAGDLAGVDLSALFGIEIEAPAGALPGEPPGETAAPRVRARRTKAPKQAVPPQGKSPTGRSRRSKA